MSDEELSLADLDGTVRTIVVLWGRLRLADRSVVMRLSPDLHDAIATLGDHVNAPVTEPVEAPREYPVEMRVKDLEEALKAYHRRLEALHHARKAWGEQTIATGADEQARGVLIVAQAFERFLADGTVHEIPTVPQQDDGAAPTSHLPRATPGGWGPLTWATLQPVLNAALAWVDHAHLKNPSGPENWRNWVDDHDVTLIDAVLAYRGLPPLERKLP
jgi:hypothetical protein